MLAFLNGKKTYILSAITILGVVGDMWSGNMDTTTGLLAIAAACGFSSVHHGVATAVASVNDSVQK